MNKHLISNHLIFLDVETTGLNPQRGHRIIEIGAVAMQDRRITGEFSSLVRTDRLIPKQATKIHGITNEMIADQPKPEEVLPEFERFISGSTLVAHNMKFDLSFLKWEYGRLGMGINNSTICTLEMSQKRFTGLPNHKLGTVYRYLIRKDGGILQNWNVMWKFTESGGARTCSENIKVPERVPGNQSHRALGDARMVAAIWLAMEGR